MGFLKKYWYLILIAIVTAGLGVIALLTGQKLEQATPVSPSVPQIQPQASEPNCQISYQVQSTGGSCGQTCSSGQWSTYTFPQTSVQAVSQYLQPDGKLRTNVFNGSRYWGYLCAFTNPVTCNAYITATLGDMKNNVNDASGKWGANALPTDSFDAVSQYVQLDGKLRTNVFKGNRYWGYECTLTSPVSCTSYITAPMTDTKNAVTDPNGSWSQYPFPTDNYDAVAQYVQPDGKLRTNVYKGDRYWGYLCSFGPPVTCQAHITANISGWRSNISDSAGHWTQYPIPTENLDAVSQYVQPDGQLRSNVYKGNRYWGFLCTMTAPITCTSYITTDLGSSAAGISDGSGCPSGTICSTNICKIPACVGESCTCTAPPVVATTPYCSGPCTVGASNACPNAHTCVANSGSTTVGTCVLTECTGTNSASCTANKCQLITNTATPTTTVSPTPLATSTPRPTVTVTVTVTPTITPNPQCGAACTSGNTLTNHTCSNGVWVLSQCLEAGITCSANSCTVLPTPTTARASCNNTCEVTSDCSSGLTCVSGACRNPSCTGQTNCTCTTSQTSNPTTQPQVPVAGTGPTWIGIGAISGGILLLLAGLLVL